MGFMSKIFSGKNYSDIDLSRPDFENAGVEYIDLGSVSLTIRDPQQTANIPLTSSVKKLNLNDTGLFNKNRVGNFTQLLYKRGWSFLGDGGKPRGGVVVSLVAMYAPKEYKEEADFFNTDELKKVAIEHCHILWGRLNEAKSLGDIGSGDVQYPTKIEQVEIKKVHGVDYAVVTKEEKDTPPTVCYFTALSERHTANITFKVGAYEGKDFYPVDIDSPDTNLKEVAYWTIEQFISHLQIKR